MADSQIQIGSVCWTIDEKHGFQIVQVQNIDENAGKASVVPQNQGLPSDSNPYEVEIESLHTDTSSLDQLVNLKQFTVANVVNCLMWRSQHEQLYTQSGLFTLATNPFRQIEGVYGSEVMSKYFKDDQEEQLNHAHVYAVVERAYRGMSLRQVDQTILVSGMSGAGKSETVKICINYLNYRVGNESMEEFILAAGFVLESLGNAFTVHNANSSRFGKHTKMFFDHGDGEMQGAKITTYLLEKTRVAHPPENERNFHIFYQLLRGLPAETKAALQLREVDDYQILKMLQPASSATSVTHDEQVELDATAYHELQKHLQCIHFDQATVMTLVRVLAAILHLGNIRFGEKISAAVSHASGTSDGIEVGEEEAISFVENLDTLAIASELLGVDAGALETAFTKLSVKNVSNIVLPLSRVNAELSRDSLISELYERLFDWVVVKMNEVLGMEIEDEDDFGYIAVLDISGYESVAQNGFEQLNINFTNDKLMQLYNELLYAEQEEYKREFGWEPIEFDTDLRNTIALIERKPEGVLPLLDSVCYRQDASDKLFVRELASFAIGTPRANVRCIHGVDADALKFSVHHAPGPVEYVAKGFVVKNRDLLAASLENLMRTSKLELVKDTLFATSTGNISSRSRRAQQITTSVGKFYIEQLSDLCDAIRETDYSFIKCIKPNAQSKPNAFDPIYIADQIKWSGVVETLQVCARGFPEHIAYLDFVKRFASLANITEVPNETPLASLKEMAKTILDGSCPPTDSNTSQYAFGQSKLFLSMSTLFQLNTLKKAKDAAPQGDGWLTKAKSAFGWLWK
jgi:myosin-5